MLCFITFSLKIYCNKDCSWEGEPNGTPFKLWEKSHGEIKSNFVSEKEEDYMASLSQHSTLIDILKHLLLPRMFVWQKIDDRVGCLDMNNGHWRIIFQMDIHTYISVGDISQIFCKWLLFLKPDIIVTVPEGRCCYSVPDVKYYCWQIAEVI